MSKAPIVLAVDTPDLQTAISWVKATQDHISVFKLGLELKLFFIYSDGRVRNQSHVHSLHGKVGL